MTSDLFGDKPEPDATAQRPAPRRRGAEGTSRDPTGAVRPAAQSDAIRALAAALPDAVHLGTSTWSFPGWGNLVWGADYSESRLAREGLSAYAQHPLLRTVSVDRSFYRPLSAGEFARLADQVPEGFRFVVKAPGTVTDAVVRGEDGRARAANPGFLDPELALACAVLPALEGLGSKLGALVFQLSPLPPAWLRRSEELFAALGAMLERAVQTRDAMPGVGHVVFAVEVRDAGLLGPALADCLRRIGASYCIGVHPRMPPVQAQLPMLRALWPGPALCRWNLNARHGAQGYEHAKNAYGLFNEMVDPDPDNRAALARLVAGTVGAGWPAYITINNKAEGSAPRSVEALARAISDALARVVAPK